MADLNRLRRTIREATQAAAERGYRTAPDVWGIKFDDEGGNLIVEPWNGVRPLLHPLACVGAFLPFGGAIPRPPGYWRSDSTIFYIGQSLNVGEAWCWGFVNGFNGTRGLESGTDAYRLGREMRAELGA